MKLRHDPFQAFRSSKTPAGLYARQQWLQADDTPQWQKDFRETVKPLLDKQLPDGSWHRSPLTTIARLFELHLTVRSAFLRDAQCAGALDTPSGGKPTQKGVQAAR